MPWKKLAPLHCRSPKSSNNHDACPRILKEPVPSLVGSRCQSASVVLPRWSAKRRHTNRSTNMVRKHEFLLWFTFGIVAILLSSVTAQSQTTDPKLVAKRNAIESELQSLAIVERKLMIPMRDGKRMATDVYRPKD